MSAPDYAIRPPQPDCATRCGAWSIEDARAAVLRAMPDVREDDVEFSHYSSAVHVCCDVVTLEQLARLSVEISTSLVSAEACSTDDHGGYSLVIVIPIPEAP